MAETFFDQPLLVVECVAAEQEEAAAHLLDHLYQAVLTKAFHGELVLQDPNDEPAERLLNRILAAREGLPRRKGRRRAEPHP